MAGMRARGEGCAVGVFIFLSSGSFFFHQSHLPRFTSQVPEVWCQRPSGVIECNLMFKKPLVGNHKQYLPSCFSIYIFCSLLLFTTKPLCLKLDGIRQVGGAKICRHMIKKKQGVVSQEKKNSSAFTSTP